MCYGYSSWFENSRAKALRKTQEKIDALNKQTAQQSPVAQPQKPVKPVEEREKVPA